MTIQSPAIDDTLLVAFADGELDPATEYLVAEQVAGDVALAARVDMFRQTAIQLRAAMSAPDQMRVPDALLARISALVEGSAPPPPARPEGRVPEWPGPGGREMAARPVSRLRRRVWLPAVAAAAAVVGFFAGGGEVGRLMPFGDSGAGASVAHVVAEIADYHGVFAKERDHLVEVAADRQAHLETWLGERVKLAFQVPDLREYGLEFKGGRQLAVDRQPVAQLMYTDKTGAPVALCIALTEMNAVTSVQESTDGDLRLFGQGTGHHVLVVVGPRENTHLRAIADVLPGLLKRS